MAATRATAVTRDRPDPTRAMAARLFRLGWVRAARLVSRLAPPPTDRAHLLIDPGPGDECAAFTTSALVISECWTDGHYLCDYCARRAPGDAESDRGTKP